MVRSSQMNFLRHFPVRSKRDHLTRIYGNPSFFAPVKKLFRPCLNFFSCFAADLAKTSLEILTCFFLSQRRFILLRLSAAINLH